MPEKARWLDMVSVSKFRKALQSIAGKAIQQSFFRFVNVAYLKNLLSCAGSFRNGGRYNLKNSRVRNKYNLAIFPERLRKSSVIKIYDPDKVIESILEGRE